MTQARNSAGSVRRALAVLDQVAAGARTAGCAGGPGGASLTELAAALDLDKSTVLRLCAPLLEAALLQRDPATGRFSLGHGTLRLGQDYLEGLDLRTVAAPHLTQLLETTGSTCHLVVRDGLDAVYIDKKENTAVVRMASRIGHRLPLRCTAVGKAILASGPASLVEEVIAAGLHPVTARTITDPHVLRAELVAVRRRGYAIDDGENEPDVRCVAAPLFDHTGHVAGAVSVSALASHTPPLRVRELGDVVSAAARAVSLAMGSRRTAAAGPGGTPAVL